MPSTRPDLTVLQSQPSAPMGGLTAQQMVDLRDRDPSAYGQQPKGAISPNSRSAATTSSPEMAGTMQSAQPGIFGGAGVTGYSPQEHGGISTGGPDFSRSAPQGPGEPGRLAQEMRQGMGLPQFGAGPGGGVQMPASAYAQTGNAVPGMAAIQAPQRTMSPALSQPPPQQQAVTQQPMRSAAMVQDNSSRAAADAPAPQATSAAASTSFTTAKGVTKDLDGSDWKAANNNGVSWADWVSSQTNPNRVLSQLGMDNLKGLPGTAEYQQVVNIPSTAQVGDITDSNSPYYIANKKVQQVAVKYAALAQRHEQMASAPAGTYAVKDISDVAQKMDALGRVLGGYGITFNPQTRQQPSTPPTTDPGTTPPPTTPPTTTPPDQGTSPPAQSGNPYQTPGEGYAPFRNPRLRNVDNLGNTDLPTQVTPLSDMSTDVARMLRDRPNGVTAEEWSAAMEFENQRRLYEQALQRQQKGVNINEAELERIQNDPLRAKAEAAALDMFANPSGVDYQGIRNRYTSDMAASQENALAAAASSAAARGLGAEGMGGFAGWLKAQSGNQLARGLGELSTEEQMANREGLYRAISNAANVSQAYGGAESMASQILANAVLGTPQAATNPYSGMADTSANLAALRLARQQAAEADQGTDYLGMGMNLFGTLGGALLGNPALGSILGSAAGNATKKEG